MPTKSLGDFVQCPVCRTSHAPTNGALKDGVYASTCENCGHFFKFKATGHLKSSVTFTINNKSFTVGNEYAAALSLNEFMRSQGVSYGTKVMCMEGGCGVCLVTTTLYDPITKATQTYTVNSCLVPLYTCDGMQVTTIEGLGNPRDGLHPIQDRLAQYNGSQCGFCSPAQVMNMYGLLKRTPKPTMQEVENAYDTTVCRCTGYRPILDAMKSFAADATPNLPGGTIDIEELDKKICKKTGTACTGRCSSERQAEKEQVPLHIVLQGSQWYKPTTKQQLYDLLGQHQGDNYRLVFGNSGFGAYKEIGPWMYDVLIDLHGIQDFYDISVDASKVTLGSSITLTNMMEVFKEHRTNPGLSYFRDFANRVSVIANSGVRNLGSWAGNLMLKNLHTEFPSDVFTMFETVGATLNIGSSDGSEKSYSLMEFLTLDMKGKVILSVLLPTFPSGDVFVKTFKVSQRLQDSQAYVTAGFRMQLDRSNNFLVKTKPSLVYGGVNKTLVHASNTETFLQGKQLGDSSVLKSAVATLSAELVPDTTPDLSSTTYRKSLAMSLFYKCVLGMCGEKAAARFQSGGTNLIRPVSSGTQTYDSRKDEYPLTEPMTKADATLQTSGRVRFINDISPVPEELCASFVISSVGNADIDKVDTSVALSFPGVIRYISAADIPKGGSNNYGTSTKYVEELFSSGKIVYSGQPIGLIVAVDKITADTAASMVKVTYKNVQPPIITMEDAIQKNSIFPNVAKEFKVGDAAAAIASADKKISGRIKLGYQYHFHLETQISICYPDEDGVGVSLLSSTQWADREQLLVSKVLNIPESSINVTVKRLGGSFGAKISRGFLPACAAAVATYVTRRPVRLAMNFHTNIKTVGKRYPYLADYTVGVSNDGILKGIETTVYADCGSTPTDNDFAGFIGWMDSAYYCPAWDFKPVALKTNVASNTACRGPGSCPSMFITESVMENVAKVLNKDPLEFRKQNQESGGTNRVDILYDWRERGKTNRVDILYDCGESMNPEIDIGQAEGGFVMGLGYWLTEQMIFDPTTGTALTDGTWNYKPPLAKDIPIDFRIQFLKNAPNPRGVLRAKAVGEPPLCMAASALFAVKHAIEAARKEISKDVFFPLDGPATVEAIQTACQVDDSQFVYGT
ncbi:uncharacterized protein [Haliotis asinina]|uniref:uncharacterized protein n=1 Tax=Haliotis asinina TaxID=109174 RepID=UPI0035319B82